MIIEMRTYTLTPGATSAYFKLYERMGLSIQTRILGHLAGYYSVEVGELNQVIHLWAYESLEERTRRRAELWRDPDWRAYAKELGGLVLSQRNQFLTPAPFFRLPLPVDQGAHPG